MFFRLKVTHPKTNDQSSKSVSPDIATGFMPGMVVEIRPQETFDVESTAATHSLPSRYPRAARLRVLHVGKYYPPYRGGIESHLQSLSDELKRRVDLKVIVANDNRRTINEMCDDVDVTRVGKLFDLSSAPICPKLASEIRKTKADIVHLH